MLLVQVVEIRYALLVRFHVGRCGPLQLAQYSMDMGIFIFFLGGVLGPGVRNKVGSCDGSADGIVENQVEVS